MKFNRTTTMAALLMATMTTVMASGESPLRGGNRGIVAESNVDRELYDELKSNLASLEVYYDPGKETECWMMYSIKGETNEYRVNFKNSKIKEDKELGKVTCTKADTKPEGDVKLPVKQDLKLNKGFWANEVVRDVDVEWTKDNDLEVSVKKFRSWKAKYDPNEKKCSLEYKFKTDKTTRIDFSESQISENGNTVTCKLKGADDKLPTREGLDELEKDILNEDAEWVGYEVIDAEVTWEKGDPLVLQIERSTSTSTPDVVDEDDFEDLELTYDDLKGVVTFVYKLDGGKYDLSFSGDEVTEDGLDIEFSGCREQPVGVDDDFDIEFKKFLKKVKWETRCDSGDVVKLVVVEKATFTWEDDGSCGGNDGDDDGRRLKDKKRAKGNVKGSGS